MSDKAKVLRFKLRQVLPQAGERARLKIIRGPDAGITFVLKTDLVTMGRGDESDVVLADLKTSRKHAELRHTVNGWEVVDLSSANGIVVNQEGVTRQKIKPGDLIGLGETLMEFFPVEAGIKLLLAPPKTHLAHLPPKKATSSLSLKNPKLFLFVLVMLVVGVFVVPDQIRGPTPKPKPVIPIANPANPRDLSSYLPEAPGGKIETTKTTEQLFRSGFREYRQGNYLRARALFDSVLQMLPTHKMARKYADYCDLEITTQVKKLMERGRKAQEAGQMRIARGSFESVIRLLYNKAADPNFKAAREKLDEVNKLIKESVIPEDPPDDEEGST